MHEFMEVAPQAKDRNECAHHELLSLIFSLTAARNLTFPSNNIILIIWDGLFAAQHETRSTVPAIRWTLWLDITPERTDRSMPQICVCLELYIITQTLRSSRFRMCFFTFVRIVNMQQNPSILILSL